MKCVCQSVFFFSLWFISLTGQASQVAPWQDWKPVGEGRLTWGLWVIYDSELRTPSGQYQNRQQPLALIIDYRRDIDKRVLLKATDRQWRHLGLDKQLREKWLTQLDQIWINIRKNDQLVFHWEEGGSATFYQGGQPLGEPIETDFARAFIDIWLSPQTAYPKLRNRLIGKY